MNNHFNDLAHFKFFLAWLPYQISLNISKLDSTHLVYNSSCGQVTTFLYTPRLTLGGCWVDGFIFFLVPWKRTSRNSWSAIHHVMRVLSAYLNLSHSIPVGSILKEGAAKVMNPLSCWYNVVVKSLREEYERIRIWISNVMEIWLSF